MPNAQAVSRTNRSEKTYKITIPDKIKNKMNNIRAGTISGKNLNSTSKELSCPSEIKYDETA